MSFHDWKWSRTDFADGVVVTDVCRDERCDAERVEVLDHPVLAAGMVVVRENSGRPIRRASGKKRGK